MFGVAVEIQSRVESHPVTLKYVAGFLFARSGKSTRLQQNTPAAYASPWNHQVHSQTKTTVGENYE